MQHTTLNIFVESDKKAVKKSAEKSHHSKCYFNNSLPNQPELINKLYTTDIINR